MVPSPCRDVPTDFDRFFMYLRHARDVSAQIRPGVRPPVSLGSILKIGVELLWTVLFCCYFFPLCILKYVDNLPPSISCSLQALGLMALAPHNTHEHPQEFVRDHSRQHEQPEDDDDIYYNSDSTLARSVSRHSHYSHYHSDAMSVASTSSTIVQPVLPPRTLVFDHPDITGEGVTLYGPDGPAYRVSFRKTAAFYGEELRIVRLPTRRLDADDSDVDAEPSSPTAARQGQTNGEKVVASVRRRDLLPDLAIFAHRAGRAVKVKKWLQRVEGKMPKGEFRWTLDTLAGRFLWRSNRRHRFALYAEDEREPIAHVYNQASDGTLALHLGPGYLHVEVEILTSFLVLEHKLRMKEKIEQGELMLALTGNGTFHPRNF